MIDLAESSSMKLIDTGEEGDIPCGGGTIGSGDGTNAGAGNGVMVAVDGGGHAETVAW